MKEPFDFLSQTARERNYNHAKSDIEQMIKDDVCPTKYATAIEVALDALDAMCSLEYFVRKTRMIFSDEPTK